MPRPGRPPRITYHGACVLQALARGATFGFDVMEATELPSGTVYPILRRFEEDGWVRSRWEAEDAARREGRPRRRHYALTAAGRTALAAAVERFRAHERLFDSAGAPLGRRS
jgi:DNA-binding PadR family transcriptional regulator